ncbi:hypothetical protein HU200_026482 [Digitaria exilis]|uniref:FAS1 domain-containing protein n=1 Tax=Digitaria exilis TaxID=1010633 RepID=A0A835BYA2_9POAL|nr:hypothetical protein HU200_026482 [Digitaria exilis]
MFEFKLRWFADHISITPAHLLRPPRPAHGAPAKTLAPRRPRSLTHSPTAAISLLNTAPQIRASTTPPPHAHTPTITATAHRQRTTMAASPRLAILLALLAASSALAAAQKSASKAGKASAAAAGPAGAADAAPPTDVNKALKDDQFSEFKQLLHDTRVDTQINAQLTDSYNGLTIFAPTNAAFDKLKAGVLNGLSPQDQIQLVLYCVLPRFYSLSMLGTLNGKVNTQGSGHTGPYKYDIKRAGNNVNVSTGVNSMLLGSPVSKDFPLAVYPVDKVPLPYELFGPKPPTPAPAPAPAPAKSKTKKHKKAKGIAEPPAADDSTASDETKSSAAAPGAARWVAVALGVLSAAVLGGGLF